MKETLCRLSVIAVGTSELTILYRISKGYRVACFLNPYLTNPPILRMLRSTEVSAKLTHSLVMSTTIVV